MTIELAQLSEKTDLTDRDKADITALQLALGLTLADDPPNPGTVEQVTSFLKKQSWEEVARFCCYHQQMHRLGLPPWAEPPCWIATREKAKAILAAGPAPDYAGGGKDISNCGPARLLLDMLDAGVSAFHPNPVVAVAEARQAKRKH